MFYISNKTFFAKKKICFAIFVIQMKKRERNKETKEESFPSVGSNRRKGNPNATHRTVEFNMRREYYVL